jgi:Carboxypeptidase regulatory-like domain/TonB-dependent Receptor Plug Domain
MKIHVRLLLLGALAAGCGLAQFDSATVLGTVHDPTGSVITNAKITLRNVATAVTASTTTNASGNYEFLTVKIGDYTISAEAPGFASVTTDKFNVAVNARQRVDITLTVGTATESITVTGAATLVETDSSDKGQVVNGDLIENMPLNGRNYADLSLLAPGVQRSLLGLDPSTPRESSFNVNGLTSAHNNFTLDGVDNNAYGTSNQGYSNQVVQVSPDAVAEFKVQTNNYSAEYGRAGGAVINASLKGGTNQYHGSVYEYLRNTNLNAIGFFKPANNVKPVLIQNQFGFSVGGPIKKNKLFFFADYEGFRRISKILQFATIPTVAQREGNLGIPVQDPITGTLYANGIIPASAISAFAKKVLGDLPAPTTGGSNNLQSLPRQKNFNDKGDVKIDDTINSKTSVFARVSHRKENDLIPGVIPGPSGGSANGHLRILNQQLTLGATYTPAATELVEARLGISKTKGGKTPLDFGAPGMLAAYGIPGIPEDPINSGGLNTQQVSGYTDWGRQNSNPQHQDPFVVNPRVNVSKIFQRHTLKFGFENQVINTEVEDFHPKYGQDVYNGQFSKPSTAGSNNLYNLADFMFGARAQYNLTNTVLMQYRQRMYMGYVQDDWKVGPKLTINAGLRYEFSTPQYEDQNRIENYDPGTNKLYPATKDGLYGRSTLHPDRNNFAPRVGLAYSIDRKTVIRSAYGISYIQFNRAGGENLLAYNGPNIVTATINQKPSQGVCKVGQDPTTCFLLTQQGYPPNLATPANFNPATSRVTFIPSDFRTPYVQSWHFTVQREIVHNLLLDVAYVGNHGTKLMVLADWNQARPAKAGENLTVDQRRPIPGFGYIEIAYNGNSSMYHAFQSKLEKRTSHGLYVLNSFTWSKAIDFASAHLETANGDTSRWNLANVPGERGLSSYDRRLNDTLTVIYKLPNGHGWASYLYGGWNTSLINSMFSGQPVNITWSPAANSQISTVLNYRPNLVGDPNVPGGDPNNFLDKNAVTLPDAQHPYGNMGRNVAKSSPTYQTDLRIEKDFVLKKDASPKLAFQAECFNLWNKTNFRAPNSNRSNSNYGTITSTFSPRIMQMALRFTF